MVNLLGAIPLSTTSALVGTLGVVGLLMIFWWVGMQRENTRFIAQQEAQQEHQETVAEILKQYKADVDKVTGYYERNVQLVEDYSKLAGELANIIHLNTQVQTRLVESIKHNMFCPLVREAGPQRER